jgi:hypothetical protein
MDEEILKLEAGSLKVIGLLWNQISSSRLTASTQGVVFLFEGKPGTRVHVLRAGNRWIPGIL